MLSIVKNDRNLCRHSRNILFILVNIIVTHDPCMSQSAVALLMKLLVRETEGKGRMSPLITRLVCFGNACASFLLFHFISFCHFMFLLVNTKVTTKEDGHTYCTQYIKLLIAFCNGNATKIQQLKKIRYSKAHRFLAPFRGILWKIGSNCPRYFLSSDINFVFVPCLFCSSL